MFNLHVHFEPLHRPPYVTLWNYLLSARDKVCPGLSKTVTTAFSFPSHWFHDIPCSCVYVSLFSALENRMTSSRETTTTQQQTPQALLCRVATLSKWTAASQVSCKLQDWKPAINVVYIHIYMYIWKEIYNKIYFCKYKIKFCIRFVFLAVRPNTDLFESLINFIPVVRFLRNLIHCFVLWNWKVRVNKRNLTTRRKKSCDLSLLWKINGKLLFNIWRPGCKESENFRIFFALTHVKDTRHIYSMLSA